MKKSQSQVHHSRFQGWIAGKKKEKKKKNKGKERNYVCVDRFEESGEWPADPVVEMCGAWDRHHTHRMNVHWDQKGKHVGKMF